MFDFHSSSYGKHSSHSGSFQILAPKSLIRQITRKKCFFWKVIRVSSHALHGNVSLHSLLLFFSPCVVLTASVPPPASSRLIPDQQSEYSSYAGQQPSLTEEQVRQALLSHIAKHSCYGRDAAKSHTVTSLQASSASHVSLLPSSFTFTAYVLLASATESQSLGFFFLKITSLVT